MEDEFNGQTGARADESRPADRIADVSPGSESSAELPLPPFVLERRIGTGGAGVVWRGRHPEQNIVVAVKLIPELGNNPQKTRRRFRSEVRAVAALDHPGIVTVLDYGDTGSELARASDGRLPADIPYLVTEYARAGTLADYLTEADWPFCRTLLLALLDALAHAHARGVIHRDIKPTNILLDDSFRWGSSTLSSLDDSSALHAKLTDFGLAFERDAIASRLAADEPSGDEARGTPFYMAPELLQSRWRDFGPWTDLYGLGCMAWQMITGRRPFLGDSMFGVARAQLVEPVPTFEPRFDVPDRLVNWLVTLLQKRPVNRFQSAADAAAALTALDDDLPRTTESSTPSLQPPRASFSDEWTATSETLQLERCETSAGGLDLPDTFPTPDDRDDADPPAAPLECSPPPLPDDWSRPGTNVTPMALVGAGRELFGLRKFPLAGRRDERDLLWNALHRVVDDQSPRVVRLHGPAGIGKTRLARWLLYRAREIGAARTMRARHDASDGFLAPLREMLARYLESTGLPREALRERVVAEYTRGADTDDTSPAVDTLTDWLARDSECSPKNVRSVFDAVFQFLERVAARRPLVIHLDDLHDGEGTLEWLRYVLRTTDRARRTDPSELPVLFVATHRDERLAERPAEADLIAELSTSERVHSLRLEPLDNHALRRLLERGLRLEPGLAFRVVARADGNPLFATQLVRDWLERGLLEVADDGFTLPDEADPRLPDDIYAVWSDRLERALGEAPRDQRVALELGAVLGRQPREEEWRAACRRADVPFPEQLVRRLLKQRLLEATEIGWSFPHGMVRETLERDARRAGRWSESNRICADVVRELHDLEALSGYTKAAGLYRRLAHLRLEADEPGRAVDPLVRAVEANGRLGRLDAVEHLLQKGQSAVERADLDEDDPKLDRLALKRARYYVAQQSSLDEARALFQAVLDRNEQHPDRRELRARALAGLARHAHITTDARKSARYLQQALRICPEDHTTLRAQILRELGVPAQRFDDLDAPDTYLDRARDLLDDAPVERAKVLGDIGNLLARQNARDEAIDTLREALSIFREHRCRAAEANVLNRIASFHRQWGHHQRALELFDRAEAIARSVARHLLPLIRLGLAEVALERENYPSALEILARLPDDLSNESLARLKTAFGIVAHLGLGHRPEALERLERLESHSEGPLASYPEFQSFLRQARTLADDRGHADIASRIDAILCSEV